MPVTSFDPCYKEGKDVKGRNTAIFMAATRGPYLVTLQTRTLSIGTIVVGGETAPEPA